LGNNTREKSNLHIPKIAQLYSFLLKLKNNFFLKLEGAGFPVLFLSKNEKSFAGIKDCFCKNEDKVCQLVDSFRGN
jgi:hypothetical protein